MTLGDLGFVLAAVGGLLLLLLIPVMRLPAILILLICARSLTDVGSASGDPLLPNTLLNAAIAVGFLVLVLFSPGRALSYSSTLLPVIGFLVIALTTALGLANFGMAAESIQEGLRLLSVLAVFVIAVRVGSDYPKALVKLVPCTVLPATIVFLVGWVLESPFFVQATGRVAGTFSHANAAAAFMSVSALSCLGIWFFYRSKILLLAGTASLLALVLTQSLGGLAGFLAGSLAILIINTRLALHVRLIALLGTTIIAYAITAYSRLGGRLAAAGESSFSVESSGDASLRWRLLNWSMLLQEWSSSPWLGYGLGSTSTLLMPLSQPPHSLPIQLLVETGIFGMAIIVVVLLFVLQRLAVSATRGRWEASVLLGIIALMLVNGSESNLLGYTGTLYLIAFIGGLLVARSVEHSRSTVEPVMSEPKARTGAKRGGLD
jgi:O-antigen ligase